jgi:uncharacterized oxidoreductase
MLYHAEPLRRFATELFAAAGFDPGDAALVAESLVESNLRGHDSHGIVRVADYIGQLRRGEVRADARFEVLHETPALLVADGGCGLGQVQCRRLVERVAEKARVLGVACGTLKQCGHIGRLGEWVELAAALGLAGLISVNDNGVAKSVAPPGGTAPRISTNPLAIGVPTAGEPLVLDISTSAVANGKVTVSRLAGKPCPPGWLQDANGDPTTDPHAMRADPPGSLLPFGGEQAYKGFGLGLLFDMLVGGLSGGFCPPAAPGVIEFNNVLFVAWDPVQFAGRPHFVHEIEKLVEFVRETPRKPGVDRIQLPGDRSAATREERLRTGIPLPGDNWNVLETLARELNVPLPEPSVAGIDFGISE